MRAMSLGTLSLTFTKARSGGNGGMWTGRSTLGVGTVSRILGTSTHGRPNR